jgi:(S)-3,5-dihydroxyphenylglycine transaminase
VPFEAGDDVLERSARDHGVLWTPIHHFYGEGRPRKQLRLSCSHLSPAEITEGLGRLAGFIRTCVPTRVPLGITNDGSQE